jgi:hypothetical protein
VFDEAGLEARIERLAQHHLTGFAVHAVVFRNHFVAAFGTEHVFGKQVDKETRGLPCLLVSFFSLSTFSWESG